VKKNKTLTQRTRIEDKIAALRAQLLALQESCPHPELDVTHRADTGNYDPSCNRYWIEYWCPDCDLHWTEDQ
jgi:hypothetical protein